MTRKCTHPRKGIVTTHPNAEPIGDGGHAATNCCDRSACITAAVAWVARSVGMVGHYSPDPQPRRST